VTTTRWAVAPRWMARVVLFGLVLLVGYGAWQSSRTPLRPRSPSAAGTNTDVDVYRPIADRVRHGEPYYPVAAAELAAAGFPTRSVFNFRLPTLAWLLGALPSDRAGQALLIALAALTLVLWFATLWQRESFAIALAGGGLLLGLLAWPALDDAYLVHDLWAGVLIALSLVALGRGWFAASITAGAAALFVRELSLLYVCLAAADALANKRRRHAVAWALVIVAFGLVLIVHAKAVAASGASTVGTTGAASWLRFGGWEFVLKTALMNAWLISMPPVLVALILPVALVGLAGWRGSPGTQVATTIFAYVAAFLVVGQPFNHLWGFLYVGPALMGLAFAPAALRDLWRRAQ
jgi:hypothetical protein